jgi:uncharacterized protein (DUF362 family)
MIPKVAVVEFEEDAQATLERALTLVGRIDNLNLKKRPVTIKVGVYDPTAENHTTVNVLRAIISCFNKAPSIFVAESDNYKGEAMARLQIWRELFTGRVVPFSLSADADTREVDVAGEKMKLSHIIFKPNVFVSTHVLRGFERGAIMKNLFGLVPDPRKAKFHKVLDTLLPDIYEAIGGIDLAVIDGTYLYSGAGAMPHVGAESTKYRVKMNTLVVGRDAIAVEAVGADLAGLKPERMPVLQEAMKRGLGQADLEKIEIVGSKYEDVKEKFSLAVKTLKAKKRS